MAPARTTVRLTLLAGALATAAGCTSSASPSGPAGPSSSPAPSSQAASRSPASTTPAAGTSSASRGTAAVASCRESQLRASLDPRPVRGQSSGADGDKAIIVDFRNISASSCTLHGYPGAALAASDGAQVVQATRTVRGRLLGLPVGRDALPTVTLRPGATASAGIEGVNRREVGAAQAGCDATYPRLLVTPPNTDTAVPFRLSWPRCYSFTVHPTNLETNPPA